MSLCYYDYNNIQFSNSMLPSCPIMPPVQEQVLVNQCPKISALSKNLCEDPEFFITCEGNLGVPRLQMPQLSNSIQNLYLEKIKNEGIIVENRSILASQLTSVQNQVSGATVSALLDSFFTSSFDPCDNEIIVSYKNKDGKYYVIDGHHRYTACRFIGGVQKIMAIYEDINTTLLDLMNFPGVKRSNFENLEQIKKNKLGQVYDPAIQ